MDHALLYLLTLICINVTNQELAMTLTLQPKFEIAEHQDELIQKTLAYERASLSPNTLRTYKSMWKKFEAWCDQNNLCCLPATAETIALYLASIGEEVSFSTLDSTIAAIEAVHEKAGLKPIGDVGLYRRVRKGIRREHKENQSIRKAKPITLLDLKGVCCRLGASVSDKRDKALLTIAFFGAFRRSEVVGLDVNHLEFSDKGVEISLMHSKTSDTKQTVCIAYAKDQSLCPVLALRGWLDAAGIQEGAVFRSILKGGKISNRLSGHSVAHVIKRYFGDDYSGHSARRGPAIEAAERGVSIHTLKKIGRWKGADMAMRYTEQSASFQETTTKILGV